MAFKPVLLMLVFDIAGFGETGERHGLRPARKRFSVGHVR